MRCASAARFILAAFATFCFVFILLLPSEPFLNFNRARERLLDLSR
jgi:hypothetical protein